MLRTVIIVVLASALCFPRDLDARENMPQSLPAAIDAAVGVCIDFLAGKRPRAGGGLKKVGSGFVRTFPEGSAGTLSAKFALNGSSQPRTSVSFKANCICRIYNLKLGGGYKSHFAQTRAGFERRGWSYSRRSGPNLSSGDRRILLKGSRQRSGSSDALTIMIISEWGPRTGNSSKRLRNCVAG